MPDDSLSLAADNSTAERHNAAAWDAIARAKHDLTQPATADDLVDPLAKVDPLGWLGKSIAGKRLLCLAAGGGKHSVIYAAAGAIVTVVDISEQMLAKDREAAARFGLNIQIRQSSMVRLTGIADAAFDIVIHPVSTCYVPRVQPVFQEVVRVLSGEGLYISQHKSPVSLQVEEQQGRLCLTQPYYRQGPLPKAAPSRLREQGTLEYLHRYEELIGGMCRAGFVIEDLVEPLHAKADAMPGTFAHRCQTVAPYLRIKARRTGKASNDSSPRIATLS